ncbi:MAG TPA: ornithine cyclodeaminase family protein [Solirubrobacterales bacterium]|nr:ornithine cyclodeaminase family protein [Solirubrobacterales bacterium]
MATLLREADVERVIKMEPIIDAVTAAMRELGEGIAENIPRRRVYPPGNVLSVMFASYPGSGYYGLKSYSIGGGRVRFLVVLYRQGGEEAGNIDALIEGNLLGAYRTGAASGVAARELAPAGAVEVGVIGSGWQARTQIHAISRTIPVTRFRVYSRDPERRSAFAAEMSEVLGIEATAVSSAEEAVRGAPVVVTMTNSGSPVLEAGWIEPGALVIAAGSNIPNKAELPPELIERAEVIVVDQLDAAKIESGDLLLAEASGRFAWDRVVELGPVLAGKAEGRRSADGIVLFESHGLALWDVAAGSYVLGEARRIRLGSEVTFFPE